MTNDLKYQGVPLKLGRQEYILPALPLKRLKEASPLMTGTIASDGYVDTLIQAVYWSLLRNYPELKVEEVEDSVDMLNYGDVVKAFTAANGFVVTEQVASTGEASASQ
jgi:hypothetical protein